MCFYFEVSDYSLALLFSSLHECPQHHHSLGEFRILILCQFSLRHVQYTVLFWFCILFLFHLYNKPHFINLDSPEWNLSSILSLARKISEHFSYYSNGQQCSPPNKAASFVISCYAKLVLHMYFYVLWKALTRLSIPVPPFSSESNLKMWEPSGFYMHRRGKIICQSECHLI